MELLSRPKGPLFHRMVLLRLRVQTGLNLHNPHMQLRMQSQKSLQH
jgi:hypothetical protein